MPKMPTELCARTDLAVLPPFSAPLAAVVDRIADPHSPIDPWRFVTQSVIAEARRAFIGLRTQPPTREALTTWLLPIAAAVRNPPGDDLPAKISAVGQACGDLPGWTFSLGAQTEAMRRWQWWPAAADVHVLLVEYHAVALANLAALRRIATTTLPSNTAGALQRAAPSDAERQAVRAVIQQFVSERAVQPKPVVTSKPLTPAQLDAARRQSGLYPHLLGKRRDAPE
jgi:hypothetical protein